MAGRCIKRDCLLPADIISVSMMSTTTVTTKHLEEQQLTFVAIANRNRPDLEQFD